MKVLNLRRGSGILRTTLFGEITDDDGREDGVSSSFRH